MQIAAGYVNRRPVRLLRSIQVSQDNQCFSDGCVFPIVIWLGLADFQDLCGQAAGLVRLFEEKSDRRRVYSRVKIWRLDFEGAIVAIERLPQTMFVGGIRAPLILVGSTKDAQCLAVGRVTRDQGCQNFLGTRGRAHLRERQRHALFEPVVLRMKLVDGRARGIVRHQEFARGKRPAHKVMGSRDIGHPFCPARP